MFSVFCFQCHNAPIVRFLLIPYKTRSTAEDFHFFMGVSSHMYTISTSCIFLTYYIAKQALVFCEGHCFLSSMLEEVPEVFPSFLVLTFPATQRVWGQPTCKWQVSSSMVALTIVHTAQYCAIEIEILQPWTSFSSTI
jgi:hypothetical protein